MNDRVAYLSSRILEVVKDEPFDVMPVLGTVDGASRNRLLSRG